jgi:hypothetical protein
MKTPLTRDDKNPLYKKPKVRLKFVQANKAAFRIPIKNARGYP